jgi:hypothetical protein
MNAISLSGLSDCRFIVRNQRHMSQGCVTRCQNDAEEVVQVFWGVLRWPTSRHSRPTRQLDGLEKLNRHLSLPESFYKEHKIRPT